jgi:Domain of unknown function (DUF5655)
MDENDFFAGHAKARSIFQAVQAAAQSIGAVETRVSKSQIGFYHRKRAFASTWRPAQHRKGERPPLVLTVYLRRRDPSPRWKQIVEPRPGRFTHHIELHSRDEVDDEVRRSLAEAWQEAG